MYTSIDQFRFSHEYTLRRVRENGTDSTFDMTSMTNSNT